MAKKTKPAYKIRNGAKYNEALVNRGNLTFWISDELIDEWRHDNPDGLQGRPFFYSDLAIETLLTIRELYHLTYRATEGFGKWIFELMRFDLPIPDYTSLCKRAAKLDIDIVVSKKKGKIDVVLDSTGLKVYGEGEWKTRTHGKSKRRTWRKLHLMIDPESQEIIADESLVETTMFRMKTIFGAHLKNRLLPNQKTESRIRCKILNHFTRLGMPKYD